MRKICSIIVALVIIILTIFVDPLNAYSSDIIVGNFNINVNGSRVIADVPPVVKDGRMMVPLRGVVEKLGGVPEWNEADQLVTITFKDKTIIMGIGSKLALVNNKANYMDISPLLYNDRTLVPLRFIAESMGMLVKWIPESNLAEITDPEYAGSLPALTVMGYSTNDSAYDKGSYNSLTANYNNLNSVATFSYLVDSNGNLSLTGYSQASAVEFANSNGIKPLMLIHNLHSGGFDRTLAHDLLANEANRNNLVNNILTHLRNENYAGVNVDLENVYWYDRPYYTSLIKELKEALSPEGFLTTVAIPAKTYDAYQNSNWNGAFDYKEIGKYADQVLLMTYDEHYSGGAAGPVASYTWVEKVLKYAVSVIPSEKILLGIPGYGYDWASTGTKAVAMKNIDKLISSVSAVPKWDDTYKSPYFTYYKNGVYHEVWYENATSISAKFDLVKKYSLGGIGLWRLGYENESFWNVVREKLNIN